MKQSNAIILLFALFSSCSKTSEQINTTKTDKHIKIAGTNVYLIPPPNFGLTATGEELLDYSTAARISVSQKATAFNASDVAQSSPDAETTYKDVRVNQYEGIYKSRRKVTHF